MKKNNPAKLSERPSKKHEDENPDKRLPNPEDPYEQTGFPIKEMPVTDHPHREELLD